MSSNVNQTQGSRLYRVDRFIVPAHGRAEFLERVAQTHALLREQKGFGQDFILEEPRGDEASTIVTVVEWLEDADVPAVVAAVAKMHAEAGFDRREMMQRLGIVAEIGTYRRVVMHE